MATLLLAAGLLLACGDDNDTPPADLGTGENLVDDADVDEDGTVEDAAAGEMSVTVDATSEDATAEEDATTGDGSVAACPSHTDLKTATLPCDCFGTIVTDPEQQMPDCPATSEIHCCPGAGGLKCE